MRQKPRLSNGDIKLQCDLDMVLAKARSMWHEDRVQRWLHTPDPDLYGAWPLDVISTGGASTVLRALEASAEKLVSSAP